MTNFFLREMSHVPPVTWWFVNACARGGASESELKKHLRQRILPAECCVKNVCVCWCVTCVMSATAQGVRVRLLACGDGVHLSSRFNALFELDFRILPVNTTVIRHLSIDTM